MESSRQERGAESKYLELKSKSDDAWYYAAVDVIWNGIRVRFPEFSGDDEIWDFNYLKRFEENLSSVVRFPSIQLQDGECARVEEGMVVCARYVRDTEGDEEESNEDIRYFDAQITKVDRNPHTFDSGEEVCTCLFVVSWMAGPGKKKRKKQNTDYLTCGDICLLNEADMESHTTVVSIRRLLQGRVLGLQAKQHPARVSVGSKNLKSQSPCATLMTEQPTCFTAPSQQATRSSDPDAKITGPTATSGAGFKVSERDKCFVDSSKASERDHLSRRAESESEAGTDDDSCSVSTEASEDLSPASQSVTKGRKTVNSQESRRVSSSRSKPNSKRMRGCVTDLVSPPPWFNPTSRG